MSEVALFQGVPFLSPRTSITDVHKNKSFEDNVRVEGRRASCYHNKQRTAQARHRKGAVLGLLAFKTSQPQSGRKEKNLHRIWIVRPYAILSCNHQKDGFVSGLQEDVAPSHLQLPPWELKSALAAAPSLVGLVWKTRSIAFQNIGWWGFKQPAHLSTP